MADKRAADDEVEDLPAAQSDAPTENEDDTEGHLLMPNIAAARAITNARSGNFERNVPSRIRQKDDRPRDKRNR